MHNIKNRKIFLGIDGIERVQLTEKDLQLLNVLQLKEANACFIYENSNSTKLYKKKKEELISLLLKKGVSVTTGDYNQMFLYPSKFDLQRFPERFVVTKYYQKPTER